MNFEYINAGRHYQAVDACTRGGHIRVTAYCLMDITVKKYFYVDAAVQADFLIPDCDIRYYPQG